MTGFRKRISLMLLVIVALSMVTAGMAFAAARGAWAPNTAYAVNDTVTYGGSTYKALQAHTSQVGWEPPNVPALWQLVTGTTTTPPPTTPPPTNPPATTPPPTSSGTCWAAWVSTTAYNGGAQVSRFNQNYQAAYWTQNNDPATNNGPAGSGKPWIPKGACTGGSTPPPTTPPPTTPPATTPPPTTTTVTPPPTPGRMFAPYLDVSPGPNSTLGNLAGNRTSVSKMYTLAFILGRGCSASWFGTFEMNTAEANGWATRINELRAAGGDVIVAFGGAAAPELANVCTTVSSLQAQYQAVVTKYNLKYIDLDIEDFSPTAIDLRNKALKGLEAANPNLHVHYTLGVLPTGMTQSQIDVLNNAKANGTRVDVVNIMAMDYGQGVADMGGAAIQAAQATRTQLNNLGFSSTKIGITPMIGTNDTHETFTLQDAQEVETWAMNNGIVLLAFWSVGRDNGGCANGTVSPSCSGIAQSTWQFSSIFRPFMP